MYLLLHILLLQQALLGQVFFPPVGYVKIFSQTMTYEQDVIGANRGIDRTYQSHPSDAFRASRWSAKESEPHIETNQEKSSEKS